LAGPVVAAAVYIAPDTYNHPVWRDVQDSKKLSSSRREVLFSVIQSQCHYGIAEASVEEIDSLNILQATFLAMRRAIEKIKMENPYILIDGNRLPKNWPWDAHALIKGDTKSVSIAAASILAKVTRDRMMCELGKDNPEFGWANNAGYGTAEHLSALDKHGITPYHRKTFAPVRDRLNAA
jgi:ribonuclease HII